jgi:hypothetical protein
MFQLSTIEHIRLSFGSAIAAYEGHADAAARLATWSWYAKLGLVSLVGASAILAVAGISRGAGFQAASAATAVAALIASAIYIAFDPLPRIYGHRISSARLWLVCEKYRALLAEIQDEAVDAETTKERRNALLQEVAVILEQGPPPDRDTMRIAGEALRASGGRYTEDHLDRYLPPSLRRPASGAATKGSESPQPGAA